MSKLQKIGFVSLVIAQLLVLGIMIAQQQLLLRNGTPVLLETAPIDPRSLFSGDYVILNYKLNEPKRWFSDRDLRPHQERFRVHQTVYVAIREGENKFWEPVEMVSDVDKFTQNYPVFIRGKIQSRRSRIRYGVEQYFVPQGQGLEIERADEVSTEIAVSSSGASAVKRIFIKGKEVRFR